MSSENSEANGYGRDFRHAHHLAIIAMYFISFEKWVQRESIHLKHVYLTYIPTAKIVPRCKYNPTPQHHLCKILS